MERPQGEAGVKAKRARQKVAKENIQSEDYFVSGAAFEELKELLPTGNIRAYYLIYGKNRDRS